MSKHWQEIENCQQDQRSMAAGLLIVRSKNKSGSKEVFLIQDKHIAETGSGLTVVSTATTRGDDAWRWGMPGGGRQVGETYKETLRRELDEEVGVDLPELGLAERLVYPFLVAQWADIMTGTEIRVLPAACTVLDLDEFGFKAKREIEKKVNRELAIWQNIEWLAEMFQQLQNLEVGPDENGVENCRLWVFCAAYVYKLRTLGDTRKAQAKVMGMNRTTYQYVLRNAQELEDNNPGLHVTIKNGVIRAETGAVIPNDGDKTEQEFLFGTPEKFCRNSKFNGRN